MIMGAGWARPSISVQLVFPAFLPAEVRRDEVLKWDTVQPGIKPPAVCDVPDHQPSLAVPPPRQVIKEPADPRDRLAPALAAWVTDVQIRPATGVQLRGRHAISLAVVALAQPPVKQHGHLRAREGEPHRLHGPGQIRAEHRGETVIGPAPPQFPREATAALRELARQPAGRHATLIVHGDRVGLEQHADRHRAGTATQAPRLKRRAYAASRLTTRRHAVVASWRRTAPRHGPL